jgi:hypothetical protein
MSIEGDVFNITEINNNTLFLKDWHENFGSYKKIKELIKDIYEFYDSDKYSSLLSEDKIIINNLEQLVDKRDIKDKISKKKIIYICGFSFKDGNNKIHSSIIIAINKLTFILHNYEVDKDANDIDKQLLVYDKYFSVRPNNSNSNYKLNDPIYFFIKNNNIFEFSYIDKLINTPSGGEKKHIKFENNFIKSILDFTDSTKPFINHMRGDPTLYNSYINDKYIGALAINNNKLEVYNLMSVTYPYIEILLENNDFSYSIKDYSHDNLKFNLTYSVIDEKPFIEIKIDDIVYKFTETMVSYVKNTELITQYYSINKKYIPLYNNSTAISSLILLGFKVKELVDDRTTGNLIKKIRQTKNIFSFINDDIKEICSVFDNCEKEKNLIEILNNLISVNSDLFNFKVRSTYNIINKNQFYEVYENINKKFELYEIIKMKDIFNIEINEKHTNIDLNKLIKSNIPEVLKKDHGIYYYKNKENNKYIKIENNSDINLRQIIYSVNNYFMITFNNFNESGEIINNNIYIENLFNTLIFDTYLLVPTLMIYFVGNNLDTGYYITIQYYNNNWYVFNHKHRIVINVVDYYFNIKNMFPICILYKTFDGTTDTIYNELNQHILLDKFSNDKSINYYLNPHYELLKYKETLLYSNYDLEKVIISMKEKDKQYFLDDKKSIDVKELLYGINSDLNETTVLNLHTPTFMDNFIENKFNIDNTKIIIEDTLFN